jgi:hypothetical protein
VLGAGLVLTGVACAEGRAAPASGTSPPLIAFVTTVPTSTTIRPTTRSGATTTATDGTAATASLPPPMTAKPGTPLSDLPVNAPVTGGNRLLLLGDSVMAILKPADSNAATRVLVPLGWHVTIDAEVGRTPEQVVTVLRQRPAELVDVAVVLIGNNYGGNRAVLRAQLRTILALLHDVPRILLLTVEQFRPSQGEVNAEIVRAPALDPRVEVVDWDSVARRTPGTNRADGLHLTGAGAGLLADTIGRALGPAPA